jgi:hypothetical protein
VPKCVCGRVAEHRHNIPHAVFGVGAVQTGRGGRHYSLAPRRIDQTIRWTEEQVVALIECSCIALAKPRFVMELASSVDIFYTLGATSMAFWETLETTEDDARSRLVRKPAAPAPAGGGSQPTYSSAWWMEKIASLRVHSGQQRQSDQEKTRINSGHSTVERMPCAGADVAIIEHLLWARKRKWANAELALSCGQADAANKWQRTTQSHPTRRIGESMCDIFKQLQPAPHAPHSPQTDCEYKFKLTAQQGSAMVDAILEAIGTRHTEATKQTAAVAGNRNRVSVCIKELRLITSCLPDS